MRERRSEGHGALRRRANRIVKSLFGVRRRGDIDVDRALNKVVELSDKVDALTFELYRVNPTNPMFFEVKTHFPTIYQELEKFARDRKLPWRPNYLGDVGDFLFKFKLPQAERPTVPDCELMNFRLQCLNEELIEYRDAVGFPDGNGANLSAVLDALVDLIYFAFGTVHIFGLGSVFGEAWRRVHAANLQKVLVSNPAMSKRGFKHDVEKPEGWKPPKLDDLVWR